MSIVFGLSGYCCNRVWRTFDWLTLPHFKKQRKEKRRGKEQRNEMKREAGFSSGHQASDLNPAGASKSLSMYHHHHPAVFVFWFLANNVTQMHMLENKMRGKYFCQQQIIAFQVFNAPPLPEGIPQKKPQICPQTVTMRMQKHCWWKNRNSRPFPLCIRLYVRQQRAIGSVCHHHGSRFFKKRFCLTGDLVTWRMRWRLQSRLIMEPPHSVGGESSTLLH